VSGSGSPDVLTVAWAFAALLFLLSFWSPARQGSHAAMGGTLILAAATLYSVDVVNMPEVVGATVIGTAMGFGLARESPSRALPRLLAALAGSVGLAAIAMMLAIDRNPFAFGLIAEGADKVAPVKALAVSLGAMLGSAASGGAATLLLDRAAARSPLFFCLLLVTAGVSAAMFVRSGQSLWLWASVAFAGVAGVLIGRRLVGHGLSALLAMTAGLGGWSVVATALLLENMGLAIAGGLAGSAGGVAALRLCRAASRKGLAHAQRRP